MYKINKCNCLVCTSEPTLDEILQYFYNKISELEERISELESDDYDYEDDYEDDYDIALKIINVLVNLELLSDAEFNISLNYLEYEIEIILEYGAGITVVKVPEDLFYTGNEEELINYFA